MVVRLRPWQNGREWPYNGAMKRLGLVIVPQPAFNLRLPDDLKEALREAAKENQRSLNAEIIWRLRQSIDGYRR